MAASRKNIQDQDVRLFNTLKFRLHYFDAHDTAQIYKAYCFARDAHEGQKRQTGEPYITHPVAVSCILSDMRLDVTTVVAALLHDVLEDTDVQKESLIAHFGIQVAELVDGVSKLTRMEFVSRAEARAENLRKMVMAMAKDIRVMIVKLADRLHNMRTLGSLAPLKRRRIATDTLDIFAPIAKRLGMHDLSVELEELGFLALYPNRYRVLKERVRCARGNRRRLVSSIEHTLREGLLKQEIHFGLITGREKHLYSIYCKMRDKHIPFSEVMDVYAFRIVVHTVDQCYRALGIVHGIYKPVPERFKDYIATPKANGYQSLHTTLFGPHGLPIEVQMRTIEMDATATTGIAAHWLYKVNEEEMQQRMQAQEWVKNLINLQYQTGNSLEFIESVKTDLFPREVYVFTPKGHILELTAGSTAVDFAYAVHTDLGNSCIGVKINRHTAPLSTKLFNGQTVEIITSKSGRPNPAWLEFVKTSRARTAIRHFLKSQQRTQSIQLGRQLLKMNLKDYSLIFKKIPARIVQTAVHDAGFQTLDDLWMAIGLGNRPASIVAHHIHALLKTKDTALSMHSNGASLAITGTEGIVVQYAACCCPVPGDSIAGLLDSGKGIVVHMDTCPNLFKIRCYSDRSVSLCWSPDVSGDFIAHLQIEMTNRRGILGAVALEIAQAGFSIEDIHIDEKDLFHVMARLKIFVQYRQHIFNLIDQLQSIDGVIRTSRRFAS